MAYCSVIDWGLLPDFELLSSEHNTLTSLTRIAIRDLTTATVTEDIRVLMFSKLIRYLSGF